VFALKGILPPSPLLAPLEVGHQREPLVNNEKFLTGQAVGLSNGVKCPDLPFITDSLDLEKLTLRLRPNHALWCRDKVALRGNPEQALAFRPESRRVDNKVL